MNRTDDKSAMPNRLMNVVGGERHGNSSGNSSLLGGLCEGFGMLVLELHTKGRVLYANDTACSVLQIDQHALSSGLNFMEDLVTHDHYEVALTIVDKTLSGSSVQGIDLSLHSLKMGTRIEVLFNAQLTQSGNLLCVGQDITERVAREQDFVRLISTANAPIFGIDSSGRINIWNQQAEHVTGFTSGEALTKDLVRDFVPEGSQRLVKRVLISALMGEETSNFELVLKTRPQESPVQLLLNATTRWNAKGEIVGVVGICQDISARKEAERNLALVAEDLMQLIDNANAPIFGINELGQVNEWNKMAVSIVGYSREEVMGADLVRDFISPDYQEKVKQVLDRALAGISTSAFEFPLYSKSGKRIEVLLNANPRRDADGKITGVVGVGQDITARMAQEQEFIRLIDTANAPIFGIDRDGKINIWNQQAEAITGFSSSYALKRNLVENFIAPDYRESVKQVLDKALAGVFTNAFEFPLFSKTNVRIEVLLNANPRRDGDGNIVGVVGVGQDITARIAQEKEYINLIDTANAPIFGIDAFGKINIWNQQAALITGFSTEYALGRGLVEEFITPDYRHAVGKVLERACAGTPTSAFEFPIFSKSGARIEVLLNANPRRDANGLVVGVCGIGQDITERKEAEQRLKYLAEDLRSLIDTANAPIFGINAYGKINEWNRNAAQITGFVQEDVMNRNLVEEFVTPDYRWSVMNVLFKALQGHNTSNFEFPIITKEGKRIVILLNANPRLDASGKITGVVGVGQDITARIAQEQEYIRLIDTANAPIFGLDDKLAINIWNAKSSEITGFAKSMVMGKNLVKDFIRHEYRNSVLSVLRDALIGNERANFELPLFTKDGVAVDLLLNATTRRNASGEIIGVVMVGQDITEMLTAQKEATRVAEEMLQLIDTANAPIFGVDQNMKVNEWNRRTAELTGYTKKEAMNKDLLADFISPEYRESVLAVLKKALKGEETANYELPLYSKSGARVELLLNATTRRDAGGAIIGVVGVAQDITDRKVVSQVVSKVTQDLNRMLVDNEEGGALSAAATAKKALTKLLQMVGSGNNESLPFWTIDYSELQIMQRIGRGAHGTVFKAMWRGKQVAVKRITTFLDTSARNAFVRELTIISGLRHPNICLFMGASIGAADLDESNSGSLARPHSTRPGIDATGSNGIQDESLVAESIAIVNEYLQRGSLVSILDNGGFKLKWKTKIQMMIDSALGLNYLHGFQPAIIHGDCKTGNMLVDDNLTIKLTDFGMTSLKAVSSHPHGGSPAFMAPELFTGGEVIEKIDVYAFAVCMWQISSREVPYPGIPFESLPLQVKDGLRPAIPTSCPKIVSDLICKCWHDDPKERPGMSVVLESLFSIRKEYDRSTMNVLEGIFDDEISHTVQRPPALDDDDDGPEESKHGLKQDLKANFPLTCRIQSSELELQVKVGSGYYADVFRGLWRGTTEVAVKVFELGGTISSKTLLVFRQEVEVISGLRHPNLLMFIGACTEVDFLAIVTKFCERGSLAGALYESNKRSGRKALIPWNLRLSMVQDCSRAISFLHTVNIIHRDLKPANLLCDNNWRTYVGDFGFSRIKAQLRTMTRCGTLFYSSPELLEGEKYTEAVDVFAFGVVLSEMIMRQKPYMRQRKSRRFDSKKQGGIAYMIARDGARPDIYPTTPMHELAAEWELRDENREWLASALAALARSCWSHDPSTRPSFTTIVRVLDSLHSAFDPKAGLVPDGSDGEQWMMMQIELEGEHIPGNDYAVGGATGTTENTAAGKAGNVPHGVEPRMPNYEDISRSTASIIIEIAAAEQSSGDVRPDGNVNKVSGSKLNPNDYFIDDPLRDNDLARLILHIGQAGHFKPEIFVASTLFFERFARHNVLLDLTSEHLPTLIFCSFFLSQRIFNFKKMVAPGVVLPPSDVTMGHSELNRIWAVLAPSDVHTMKEGGKKGRHVAPGWISLLRKKIGPIVGAFLLDIDMNLTVTPRQYKEAQTRFCKHSVVPALPVAQISRVASVSARLEEKMRRVRPSQQIELILQTEAVKLMLERKGGNDDEQTGRSASTTLGDQGSLFDIQSNLNSVVPAAMLPAQSTSGGSTHSTVESKVEHSPQHGPSNAHVNGTGGAVTTSTPVANKTGVAPSIHVATQRASWDSATDQQQLSTPARQRIVDQYSNHQGNKSAPQASQMDTTRVYEPQRQPQRDLPHHLRHLQDNRMSNLSPSEQEATFDVRQRLVSSEPQRSRPPSGEAASRTSDGDSGSALGHSRRGFTGAGRAAALERSNSRSGANTEASGSASSLNRWGSQDRFSAAEMQSSAVSEAASASLVGSVSCGGDESGETTSTTRESRTRSKFSKFQTRAAHAAPVKAMNAMNMPSAKDHEKANSSCSSSANGAELEIGSNSGSQSQECAPGTTKLFRKDGTTESTDIDDEESLVWPGISNSAPPMIEPKNGQYSTTERNEVNAEPVNASRATQVHAQSEYGLPSLQLQHASEMMGVSAFHEGAKVGSGRGGELLSNGGARSLPALPNMPQDVDGESVSSMRLRVKAKADREVRKLIPRIDLLLDVLPEAANIMAIVNSFLDATDIQLEDETFGNDLVSSLNALRKLKVNLNKASVATPPTMYAGGVDEDGLESISEYGALGFDAGIDAPSADSIKMVRRVVAELLFVIAPCLSFLQKRQLECFKDRRTFMGLAVTRSTLVDELVPRNHDLSGSKGSFVTSEWESEFASAEAQEAAKRCVPIEPGRDNAQEQRSNDGNGLLCRICEKVFSREEMLMHTKECASRIVVQRSRVTCERICAQIRGEDIDAVNDAIKKAGNERLSRGFFSQGNVGADTELTPLQIALRSTLLKFNEDRSFVVCEKQPARDHVHSVPATAAGSLNTRGVDGGGGDDIKLVPIVVSKGFLKLCRYDEHTVVSSDVLELLSGEGTDRKTTSNVRSLIAKHLPDEPTIVEQLKHYRASSTGGSCFTNLISVGTARSPAFGETVFTVIVFTPLTKYDADDLALKHGASSSIADGTGSYSSRDSISTVREDIGPKDFQFLKPISRGGYGMVFLACKTSTGDIFAVKVMNKEHIRRKKAQGYVHTERAVLEVTNHHFIVKMYYAFRGTHNLYIVMEFINGGDMASLLENVGTLEEEYACIYVSELTMALEYLHETQQIVHQDLKPSNILIDATGHIKLIDFGLSILGANPLGLNCCRVGTPGYVAPEMFLGLNHSYPVDWWAVGIILFECLAGNRPYAGETASSVFENMMDNNIEWPETDTEQCSGMSVEARALVEALLVQDPSDRLGSKGGAKEVQSHPFFAKPGIEVRWDRLQSQSRTLQSVDPPFVPVLANSEDTSYFNAQTARSQDYQLLQAVRRDREITRDTRAGGPNYAGLSVQGAPSNGRERPRASESSDFSSFSFRDLANLRKLTMKDVRTAQPLPRDRPDTGGAGGKRRR